MISPANYTTSVAPPPRVSEPNESLQDLLTSDTREPLKARQTFEATNPLYFVAPNADGGAGVLRIYREVSATQDLNLHLVREGQFVVLDEPEQAEALQAVTLMTWTEARLRAEITRRPQIAPLIAKLVASQAAVIKRRYAELASCGTAERLTLALIRHAEAYGVGMDGCATLPGFTHEWWAAEAATSREIATATLNRLRLEGPVAYSRKHMSVWPGRLREILEAAK